MNDTPYFSKNTDDNESRKKNKKNNVFINGFIHANLTQENFSHLYAQEK